jgi:hypothetical protein
MDTLHAIYYAIRGTPWWVWILFIWLLYRGINALKIRVTTLRMIFIMPLIFTALSLYGLLKNNTLYPYLLWLSMIVIGSLVGWLISRTLAIAADKKQRLIKLPGSPITLIIILFFFGMKYYLGYTAATNPELASSFTFASFKYLVYGASCGILLGRSLTYFYKYLHAPHTDLSL